MEVRLRRPWADGTTRLVFPLLEFLGRLAVIVPRPRINLILYHGALGPRAAWRAEVVPCQAFGAGGDAGVTESAAAHAPEADPAAAMRRQARREYASFLPLTASDEAPNQSRITMGRRRPLRYTIAHHAPNYYIAALRPADRVTEFGD